MDWDAPAIILSAARFGEGDAVATVMTAGTIGRYLEGA